MTQGWSGWSGNVETEAPSRNAMKTHNTAHNERRLLVHTFKSKLNQSKVRDLLDCAWKETQKTKFRFFCLVYFFFSTGNRDNYLPESRLFIYSRTHVIVYSLQQILNASNLFAELRQTKQMLTF